MNSMSRCSLTISDVEATTVVVNAGFLFRMLYPSVLLSYVFTNMNMSKIREDNQDDIPYTEVASFAISLSIAACGSGSNISMPKIHSDIHKKYNGRY